MDAIKKRKFLLRRLANYGTCISYIYFKPPKWENQIQENGHTKCANIKLGWKNSSMGLRHTKRYIIHYLTTTKNEANKIHKN